MLWHTWFSWYELHTMPHSTTYTISYHTTPYLFFFIIYVFLLEQLNSYTQFFSYICIFLYNYTMILFLTIAKCCHLQLIQVRESTWEDVWFIFTICYKGRSWSPIIQERNVYFLFTTCFTIHFHSLSRLFDNDWY